MRVSRCLGALFVTALLVGAGRADAQSVAVTWNQVALEAVAANPPSPTATTWRLHVFSVAMYDAWTAYHPSAIGYVNGHLGFAVGSDLRRPDHEHTQANRVAAVSSAAFHILSNAFPEQRPLFESTMLALGYTPPYSGAGLETPAGVGEETARRVLLWCLSDRSNFQDAFSQITSPVFPELYEPVNAADPQSPSAPGGSQFDPNRWQPLRVPNGTLRDADGNPIVDNADPSTYTDQTFVTAHWGAVRPFALTSGDQFRPPPPPQRGSTEPYVDSLGRTMTNDEAWHLQVDEVVAITAGLTDRQKVIAEFWADGPRTWTPPGHWNQIAQGLSIRDHHTLEDDVKMFFVLNGALFDAGIAAWDAKRAYDYVRPVSAIRDKYYGRFLLGWGGPGRGTQRIRGEDWLPFQELTFVTPGFAEYVSGHSTFSRAAREALRAFTGSDRLYDGVTVLDADYDGDGERDMLGQHVALPGSLRIEAGMPRQTVVLRWPTLLAAAEEAGISRLYGGIHFLDGNLRGQELGREVGRQAWEHARKFWGGERASSGEPGVARTRRAVRRGAILADAPTVPRAAATRTRPPRR